MCNNGFGGNSCLWVLIILVLIFGCGGWGGNSCGCNSCNCNDCGCNNCNC